MAKTKPPRGPAKPTRPAAAKKPKQPYRKPTLKRLGNLRKISSFYLE